MNSASTTSHPTNQNLVIHDPKGTFVAWLRPFIWIFVGFFIVVVMPYWFKNICTPPVLIPHVLIYQIILGLLMMALSIFEVFVALAKGKGTTLSLGDQSITYPGGSVAAENMLSYFKPSYWLQSTKLYKTKFDQIRHMGIEVKQINRNDSEVKYVKPVYKYGVSIQGTFGSAIINFRNEQKCHQLYSVLRQHLNAGTPVFDAREQ